ncbi:MAG: KEOPS complex N(6)-L-threonylcarbamoyladenine synthase Kae1 [Desulfurococcaceae archaeon]|uniref:tRNA N6-adenosine threonylcarbamoyltransferase n=1 Tax=Staphylothermus marinus TaxID=2280 RepID=A0A7C4D6E5_STAMA
MYVLGIESTSHTFGVGLVEERDGSIRILVNLNEQYTPVKGGIHPREAALHHSRVAPILIKKALKETGLKTSDLDGIAVALGPGLGPCLRIGASIARFLASYYDKPLIPVNHAVAHIEIGKFISRFKDPVVLYVSGGNTLIAIQKKGRYRVFGETLDIPLGNLFDTFVREIGLAPPYLVNGKHQLDICAEWGGKYIPLPYTVKGSDLSFSGLLTAALSKASKASSREEIGDICLSLREIAFNMVTEVLERALILSNKEEILVVGGVAANRVLMDKIEHMAKQHNSKVSGTPLEYSGDNGAMIAYTGLLLLQNNISVEPERAFIKQRWRLDEVELPWLREF